MSVSPSPADVRLLTGSDVRDLVRRLGVRPTKTLGQNFVTDPNTVRRIVRDAGVGPGDLVVVCPDQLGPATLRSLPDDIDAVGLPAFDRPERIDWRDYQARNEAADPGVAAAEIIRPYVRPEVYDMIRVHQDFQGRHYYAHFGADPDARRPTSGVIDIALLLHAAVQLHRRHLPPDRLSVAVALVAYRTALREYKSHPDPGESLSEILSTAVVDDYQRSNKQSRGYPRKKYDPPPGAPHFSGWLQAVNATVVRVFVRLEFASRGSVGAGR